MGFAIDDTHATLVHYEDDWLAIRSRSLDTIFSITCVGCLVS